MDKATLLAGGVVKDEVEIPGKGMVQVRGLTRDEVHQANRDPKGKDRSSSEVEVFLVVYGMVDPELDVNDVRAWFKAAPAGEVQVVVEKIMDLSGIGKDAAKEAYKSAVE